VASEIQVSRRVFNHVGELSTSVADLIFLFQESELGSWHVPLKEKSNDERARIWLCIGRSRTGKGADVGAPVVNGEDNGVEQWLP
jgi:hypothetical protein